MKHMKINVYLKDGREFLGCDLTDRPMGETERFVSFWQEESIYIVPLGEIRAAVLTFSNT